MILVLRVREAGGSVQVIELASPLTRMDTATLTEARTTMLDRGIRHAVIFDARGVTRVPGSPIYDIVAWERRHRELLIQLNVGVAIVTSSSLIRDLGRLIYGIMKSPVESYFTDSIDDALAWTSAKLEEDRLPRTGENSVA